MPSQFAQFKEPRQSGFGDWGEARLRCVARVFRRFAFVLGRVSAEVEADGSARLPRRVAFFCFFFFFFYFFGFLRKGRGALLRGNMVASRGVPFRRSRGAGASEHLLPDANNEEEKHRQVRRKIRIHM